jgi:potassium-dependent mechanosensitive channel
LNEPRFFPAATVHPDVASDPSMKKGRAMPARQRFAIFIATIVHLSPCAGVAVGESLLLNPASAESTIQTNTPASAAPQTSGSATSPAPSAPTLADKQAESAEHLRIALQKQQAAGPKDTAAAQEVAFYQTRGAVLAQQEAAEQQIKDLQSRKADIESWSKKPLGDKKFKFADLDRMKDDLASEQSRAGLLSDRLAAAQAGLKRAQSAADDSHAKSQRAQSDYENGKSAPEAADLALAANRAQQAMSLAAETLALRKREVEREQLAQEVSKLSVSIRQAFIARVAPQIQFTEQDYKDQIDELAKSEASVTAKLAQQQANQRSEEIEFQNARQALDAAAKDSPQRPELSEVVKLHQITRQRIADQIESYTQQLQQFAEQRTAWQWRYKIATSQVDDTNHEVYAQFKTVQSDTRNVLDRLANDLRNQIAKMREVRDSLTSTNKRKEAATKGPLPVLYQIDLQLTQLEDSLKIYEKNMVTIETSRRVHEKLLNEVGPTVDALTPKAIALGAWYEVEAVWNHVLMPSATQPVTVGDAVKGLVILIVGWMFSRSMAGVFATRFLRRFRLSRDATSVIRSLVFYSLLVSVVLTALNTVGFPLTAFTVLGGGLAIGVGFGSQTLVNNFIGGLIMLAERPVRLGERITFGSIDGVVEDVGFRCTKLRTETDHLVTIPNSTLVNESIENIDRRRTIRRTFTIAVTYNISRDLLAEGVQAIRSVLDERGIREPIHPIVGFEEMTPRVHFSDFAAESLNVQVTYWYAPVNSAAFAEHSEHVNFRIMEEFDRLGIDFAFPSKTAYQTNQNRRGRGRGADSYAA